MSRVQFFLSILGATFSVRVGRHSTARSPLQVPEFEVLTRSARDAILVSGRESEPAVVRTTTQVVVRVEAHAYQPRVVRVVERPAPVSGAPERLIVDRTGPPRSTVEVLGESVVVDPAGERRRGRTHRAASTAKGKGAADLAVVPALVPATVRQVPGSCGVAGVVPESCADLHVAAVPHLEMQMASGRAASCSDAAQGLPLFHPLASGHKDLGHVRVEGLVPIGAVSESDVLAEAAAVAGASYLDSATGDRDDRFAAVGASATTKVEVPGVDVVRGVVGRRLVRFTAVEGGVVGRRAASALTVAIRRIELFLRISVGELVEGAFLAVRKVLLEFSFVCRVLLPVVVENSVRRDAPAEGH